DVPPALAFFYFFFSSSAPHPALHSFPTRRSSDLAGHRQIEQFGNRLQIPESVGGIGMAQIGRQPDHLARRVFAGAIPVDQRAHRSEEHTSELQSRSDLVCRLLLEKKKKKTIELTS